MCIRDRVYPTDASIYTKAAKYNNTVVVKNQYEACLLYTSRCV